VARRPDSATSRPDGSDVAARLQRSLDESAGDSTTWLPIVAAARDASVESRSAVVRVLEKAFGERRDSLGRAEILRALEHLGGADAIRAFARLARRDPAWVSQIATRLSRLSATADRDAADALVEVIETEERRGELAMAALRALGKTRRRDRCAWIADLCASRYEPRMRREAAEALGLIASPDGLDALRPLLDDEDRRLRWAAIRALGRIRSERARGWLDAYSKRDLTEREAALTRDALLEQSGERPVRMR